MTGPYESIIGREIAPVLEHSLSFAVNKFDVARNDLRLSGAMIEVDSQTGSAIGIQLLHLKEADLHPCSSLANLVKCPPDSRVSVMIVDGSRSCERQPIAA